MMFLTIPDGNSFPIETPNIEDSRTTTTTNTSSDPLSHKADLNNQKKRLATDVFANCSSFIIVVKPKRKSRKRSRRSAEYATLEPIDESSLSELRKTYKNSLKEITLNPNETPSEALMRYNAETIREALTKANKEPMEVTAGDDTSVVDPKATHEVAAPVADYGVENGYIAVPNTQAQGHGHVTGIQQSPAVNDLTHYHQYVPQLNAHFSDPSSSLNHQQMPQNINDITTLHTYQTKTLPQNPYGAVLSSYEPVSFMEDYDIQTNPYHVSNDNGLYTALTPNTKSVSHSKLYVKPEAAYGGGMHPTTGRMTNVGNSISKVHQVSVYGQNDYTPNYKALQNRPFFPKSSYKVSSHNPYRQLGSMSKVAKNYERLSRNHPSFEHLYELMKQRLSECCKECTETLLMGLDETLKISDRGYINGSPKQPPKTREKTAQVSYCKSHSCHHDDDKFRDWLQEMAEKGYDKQYLTKDHQREYMRDGRFQLTTTDDEQAEEILYGDNQSFKRDTTIAETDTDITTPEQVDDEPSEKAEEDPEDDEKEQETDEEVIVHNNIKDKIENSKTTQSQKTNSKNHSLEPAESTTHSVYALRGKYKPSKRNMSASVYNKIYAKKFGKHRNFKKFGTTNEIRKMMSKEKERNIEEILDFLHELSKSSKEKSLNVTTESSTTTTTSSTTTTAKPHTTVDNSLTSAKPKAKRRRLKSSSKLRRTFKNVDTLGTK